MYDCIEHDYDLCARCMQADIYIYKFWTEKPWKHSKYAHTFKRRSPIDDKIEFIAHAGENDNSLSKYEHYYDK